MGRKRNQGKARRAAKAKAKQEAEERENNLTAVTEERSQEEQLRTLLRNGNLSPTSGHDTTKQCTHGFEKLSDNDVFFIDFATAFRDAFNEAIRRVDVASSLIEARNATVDEYADVWHDFAQMETAISAFLCLGTQHILVCEYGSARDLATFARFMEQWAAIYLKQTQALLNIPKIDQTFCADLHTLVKFFRRRIPCSCLDKKYEEVKSISKVGYCYNEKCSLPSRWTERSNTMYCSRCRCATYCSRECQVAHWGEHKTVCDKDITLIAEFEAKKKS